MSESEAPTSDRLERLRQALADRYEVERELGRGGMATVYLAQDEKHNRPVAIKVMRPELASTLAGDRFQREIRVTAHLEHPHILGLIDSGEVDGLLYVVLPYLEGEDLQERLDRDGFLPVDEAVEIAKEVADGLDYAHRRGVIHRDIKPGNIMLSDGHARLTDFGIARAVGEAGGSTLTATGQIIGTPFYMSPEQVTGEGELDGRMDIYALGCVLYAMLTGAPPYLGTTPPEVIAGHLHRTRPSVRVTRSEVTPALDAVIQRAMAKDPDERFETAGEFQRALESPETVPAPRVPLMTRLRRRPGAAATSAAGVVAALLITWWSLTSTGPTAAGSQALLQSIVVLPLANLSGDPEQEYFVDGMTEALMTDLSRIGALKVIARSSAMRYKDTDKPLEEIARELNVEGVIEGSVLREADQVRVTARLIDAATGESLWADRYDRNMTSILALQGEVAQAIARQIQVTLTPGEETLLTRTQEVNPEAYDAYLKGSYHWKELTPEDLDIAQRYFELALEKDPSYAPAYAGLATVWGGRGQFGLVPPAEAGHRAKESALQAIALDDGSSEAHEALAMTLTWGDWDWDGAEPEWQRALELNPNAANAHAYYAHFLAITGRVDEAIPHSERALELDPFNALFHALHAIVLCFDARWDDAIAAAQRALDQNPLMNVARGALQYAYIAKGMREEQLALQRERIARDPGRVAAFELGLADGGYEGVQRAIADTLAARHARGAYLSATGVALRYLDAGDHERAIDWLEQAYEDRSPSMPYLGLPIWQQLNSYPRFRGLMRRMNLPERTNTDV